MSLASNLFFVQSTKDAEAFFNRRLKLLEENLEKVTQALNSRRQNLSMVTSVMNQKLAMQQRQQQQEQLSS